ncbi:secretory phospholipase A2 receptor-like [Labrus mixtus]|uniref:secretory phospholipase A2 receptor-like n=1 Tax=Labrus mixtus TaxID=508554 RepID=UPI0029C0ACCD|nr:secretory phospholipase A2 receptor-like [Labrus mixtus]
MFSVILVEIVFCATYSQQSTTMMGRTLLGVLCLSGWNISSCLSLQYHYVADPKNWTEAQTYCREKYTDLATVETPEEMKQLNKTVLSSGINLEVWIGVYRKLWKWPDNYTNSGAEYRNWRNNNRIINYDFKCYVLFHNGEWYGHDCINAESFICYRGKDNARYSSIKLFKVFCGKYYSLFLLSLTAGSQQNPEFVYVSVKKNWSSAQRFCRENFIDLATVKNHSENQNIQSLVPEYTYSWIGLYWDPDTYWSDGSGSSFRWFSYGYGYTLHPMSEVCGAADLENSGRWWLLNCETKCPFVCYSVRSSGE